MKLDVYLRINQFFLCFKCSNSRIEVDRQLKSLENYNSKVDLVKDTFRLYWNSTESKFIAEVHVKTNGWFLFGFSLDGAASNSDVVYARISNDMPIFIVNKTFIIPNK